MPGPRAGDVSVLSGLKESLSKGRHSLSKRFKKKGASPSKDTLKHTVHVSDCSTHVNARIKA